MRVAVCCVAKNEELYINGFVKWYLNMGVDTIYIFDNNDEDKGSILEKCIDEKLLGKCVIFNIRGWKGKNLQQEIYTNFYNKFKNNFEWCLFVDIDEYLMYNANIKHLLSLDRYKPYEQIRVKWLVFGDNGLITRDMKKPLYKVFTKPITSSLNRNLVDKGNLEKQAKCIVKGHLDNVKFVSVHYASYLNGNPRISCLPNGKSCNYKIAIENYKDNNLYIHHYMTKSLNEFINQKLYRNDMVYDKSIKLEYYWRINEKTKDKLDYLKKVGLL